MAWEKIQCCSRLLLRRQLELGYMLYYCITDELSSIYMYSTIYALQVVYCISNYTYALGKVSYQTKGKREKKKKVCDNGVGLKKGYLGSAKPC